VVLSCSGAAGGVESLVGDMSTEMVRHYTHIRDAAKQKAVEAIERVQPTVMDILKTLGGPREAVL
jgi:hypothetical protein